MQGDVWPGYVLHSHAYKEQQLLLQLLLPELGRVSAVVRKSSGKSKSRLSWQPFQLLQLQLTGRSELKTVSFAEEAAPAQALQGELLFAGLYLNELICRLWPSQTHSDQLFQLYHHTLQLLPEQPLEPCLRQFEFALLAELDAPLDWVQDAAGAELKPGFYYQWWPELGWQQASSGWLGADLLAIGQADWQPQSLKAAKSLSRALLAPLLGTKPLTSRTLFQQLKDNG
ncbi:MULTISPECIES: DNA repair protein RecO [Rheinheimera]|uniref:DNA repair protein RecO n=1 Tax=Rheinheimera marina TaxID=1774958 RepID=A0ABV9JG47_9GAMM